MSENLSLYAPAFGALLVAITVQFALVLVSAAVTNGANPHPGLTPTEVGSFPFRAFRAHHNALENTPIFAATLLLAVQLSADPTWVNGSAAAYGLARLLHPAFYYGGWPAPRTGAFLLGLLSWGSMIGAGSWSLLG